MAKNPQPLPKYVTDLIKTYQQARINLIDLISKKRSRGNAIQYQQDLLRQIDTEIAKLNNFSTSWVQDTLPKEYRKGVDEAIRGIRDLGENIPEYSAFARLHTNAISTIIQNASDDLINANNFVGRSVKDVVRTEVNKVVGLGLSQGDTLKEVQKNVANALISEGYQHIVTKNGRKLNLDSYAETVARSTTREATNRGTINQIVASGRDLVQMSKHNSSCRICAPLEGRVYSISGTNKDFPPLGKAYSGIYANIHPNCRHVITPYVPMLADDPEGDKEFSNRPFDTDPRSQADIDRYNQSQKDKAELNRDRRQWERYKTVMPDNTPKTLSGFRAMKRANSEKFQKLQSNYKSVRQKYSADNNS